ncbi:MAG: LacI family DNA-binding transcriptional regulator [Burkholderiaceae bacterium]|nr:LacI family DNA-binding transcriptional regulator [Burkholderiaceae bacterium]
MMEYISTNPSGRRQSRASAADVAKAAGVSVSAVSRAFTPGASISARMRNRVMEAAEKLDYLPNVLARSLMTQRTHMIGVILANFDNPLYLTALFHFTRVLQQRGLRMMLLNVSIDEDLDAMARLVLQYGVDGLVVSAGAISPLLTEQCINRRIPLVAFARRPRRSKLHVVCADNVAGGRLAARQLIDAGCRSFGFLGGPRTASTSEERLKGFQAELSEAGFSVQRREHADTYTYNAGKVAAGRLLSGSLRPEAIFCANDMIAFGALDFARFEMGLSVPQDLSVIGFDDVSLSAANSFDLSTIRAPIEEMVIETIDILGRQINAWSGDWESRLFGCTYVERGTLRRR